MFECWRKFLLPRLSTSFPISLCSFPRCMINYSVSVCVVSGMRVMGGIEWEFQCAIVNFSWGFGWIFLNCRFNLNESVLSATSCLFHLRARIKFHKTYMESSNVNFPRQSNRAWNASLSFATTGKMFLQFWL